MMKNNRATFRQPDFGVNKADLDRANKLYENFYNGTKRSITENPEAKKHFSTFAMISRMVKKDKNDPTDKFILDTVKRFEKDKVHPSIAMQIAEKAQVQAQNMQKLTMIKMIPFFVSFLAIVILGSLTAGVRPWDITSFAVLKFLVPTILLIPVLIWSMRKRSDAKFDMIIINVLLQAASAFASAKAQGKGAVGALQNLGEMRRRSQAMEKSSKKDGKKDSKSKK